MSPARVLMRLAVAVPCLMALPATADMVHDEPLLFKLMLDRLEVSDSDGNPVAWKAQAWAGSELRRLWVETRGAYVDSEVADTELQVLYSHAITPYWDARIGLRADVRPTPGREWLALGVHGLAPWFVDVDAAVFIGEGGRTALRLEAEYELLLTQTLVLTPKLEMNAHGSEDRETAVGAGLSELEAGLRLRYEIGRKFAPYIGLRWFRLYGGTADFARASDVEVTDAELLAGIRAWY